MSSSEFKGDFRESISISSSFGILEDITVGVCKASIGVSKVVSQSIFGMFQLCL